MKSKYINPFTDFGFKKIFAEEASKPLLFDFLNALLPKNNQIAVLSFKNNEQLGQTEFDRKAIYDLYCENEKGEKFIVELQKAKQNYFKERTIYYATFPKSKSISYFSSLSGKMPEADGVEQAEKGEWNYNLKAVYCVSILDFTFDDYETVEQILKVIEQSNDKLRFGGFLAHAGHSYNVKGKENILAVHEETLAAFQKLEDVYRSRYPDMVLSAGDTPCMSHAQSFGPINEIRPGNLVFYDLDQTLRGSCQYSDIAVCVACPVVALHPERSEIVVYGGSVHFSKDSAQMDNDDGTTTTIYGLPVWLHDDGTWSPEPIPGCYMKKLSQEHGIVRASPELLQAVRPGDLLGILPVHSCLTADALGRYLLNRTGVWIDMMSKK